MERPHRAGRGGICGLVAFLEEHYGAVEADLAAQYGPADQLPNLWTGGLSFRRLAVLINGLPPESKTRTEADVQLAKFGSWSDEKHLLALIADQLAVSNWLFVQSKSEKTIPAPKPIQRPGVASVTPISPKALAYLDRVRAGHGTPTPRTETP